ncbi:ankyrin repeat domain-containing protein [Humidesulfovibrio sp.]
MKRTSVLGFVLTLILALFLGCGVATPAHAAWARDTSKPMSELFQAIYKNDAARVRAALDAGGDVNAVYDRDTMLCWAIRTKNDEITKMILQSPKIDVNKRGVLYDSFSDWERPPLIQAAHMGQAEIVGTLLRLGAQVNAKDSTDSVPMARGNTALIKAAQRDHADVIQVLITQGKGLDINAQTKEGCSALWLISEHEDFPTLKLLHDHGARINTTDGIGRSVLTTTFLHKKREVLEYLIANGADINHLDSGGTSTLMEAAMGTGGDKSKTYLKFVEKFLTFKPNLDLQQIKQNNGGYTALQLAALHGCVDFAKLVLDAGASIDLKSLSSGGTALHYAAQANQMDMAKLLIKRKANLDVFDKSGSTPLMLAVFQSDVNMVERLVDAEAAINVKSTVNVLVTPLVYAAANPDPFKHKNNLAIIKYLVKNKGDIDFPSGNGITALMAAARCSDTSNGYEKAALLIDKGAKLDQANDKGETALMLAAAAGNEKLVKLLMDKGADAQKKNGAGETVMSYAARAGNKGSAAVLEAKGVKPEAPTVRKTVIVGALVGKWQGFQDGLPQALYTVILNKNGTYDFNSSLTPEVLKQFPKGTMKATIAANKGTYTINDDTMIWDIIGAPPTSMKWKLENGMLVIDDKIRLKKK